MAAHRPEEILAGAKALVFRFIEHAAFDQFVRFTNAIDIFCNPEKRVQVAQPAFSVFDIRLDQIAGLPAAADAVFALRQFGSHEFRRRIADDLVVETGL